MLLISNRVHRKHAEEDLEVVWHHGPDDEIEGCQEDPFWLQVVIVDSDSKAV